MKTLLKITITLFIATFFTACNKQAEEAVAPAFKLDGKYISGYITYSQSVSQDVPQPYSMRLLADNQLVWNEFAGEKTGTYTYANKELICNFSTGNILVLYIDEATNQVTPKSNSARTWKVNSEGKLVSKLGQTPTSNPFLGGTYFGSITVYPDKTVIPNFSLVVDKSAFYTGVTGTGDKVDYTLIGNTAYKAISGKNNYFSVLIDGKMALLVLNGSQMATGLLSPVTIN